MQKTASIKGFLRQRPLGELLDESGCCRDWRRSAHTVRFLTSAVEVCSRRDLHGGQQGEQSRHLGCAVELSRPEGLTIIESVVGNSLRIPRLPRCPTRRRPATLVDSCHPMGYTRT